MMLDFEPIKKCLSLFIKAGCDIDRVERMSMKMNMIAGENLQCVECGCRYDYPHFEVRRGLTDGIAPLSFCSRKCFNDFNARL